MDSPRPPNPAASTTPTAPHPHAHGPSPSASRRSKPLRVAAFQARMPVPPVAKPVRQTEAGDEYEVEVRPAQLELAPGVVTDAFTYGGDWVGPTIRGRTGRPVKVTFRNKLAVHDDVSPDHDPPRKINI
ncbi:hypothetical protein ACFYO0_41825 [Streptomyces sp. NPDC006365]|uniref:hypothetical protein n=1 Tax=Streptomyces sp. NPDC006365 TaxID=3364744 RepID=UPI0036C0EEEE